MCFSWVWCFCRLLSLGFFGLFFVFLKQVCALKVFPNAEILIVEDKMEKKSTLNNDIWNWMDWMFIIRLFTNI